MSARRSILLVGVLAAITACGADDERPPPEPAGFLGDYSTLRPGREDQARLVFIEEEADFSGYRRVLLEPVVAWAPGGSPLAGVPQAERERLASYFDAALRRELALAFELVDEPAPGTLRMRAAITRADESGDAGSFESAVEVEVQDAVSGQRLLAAVDTRSGRAGGPEPDGAASGVEGAFDYWAEVIRTRIAAFRALDAALAESRAAAETPDP